MTNSYTGNPLDSAKDAVRFLLSDRGPTTWLMSDEEIAYLLSLYPDAIMAASWGASELSAKYAGLVDKSVGDLRISYGRRATAYQELADRLYAQAGRTSITMYIGGISKADMCTVDADSDRNVPPFSIKQFDIPNATTTGNPECDD